MSRSRSNVALAVVSLAAVVTFFDTRRVAAGVLRWLWGQLLVTAQMVVVPLGWAPPGPQFLVSLLAAVAALTLTTVSCLNAFRTRWDESWYHMWFPAGRTWQRTFVEQWIRGPASRAVVFVVANISVIAIEACFGGTASVPPQYTVPVALSIFGVAQTLFSLVAYAVGLLLWWAARLNMLWPVHARVVRVAAGVAYVSSVAAMYTYNPFATQAPLDYVQYVVVMVLNPVPTLVLGALAVLPCLWLAKFVEAAYPNQRVKATFLMYLGTSVLVLWTARMGAFLGARLLVHAPLAEKLLLRWRVCFLLLLFVVAASLPVLYLQLVHMLWAKAALFRSDWRPSITGAPATRMSDSSGRGRRPSAAVPRVWEGARLRKVPPLFQKLSALYRDTVRTLGRDRASSVRTSSVMRIVLSGTMTLLPFLRRALSFTSTISRAKRTSFEVVVHPVVSNPTGLDLEFEDVQLQVRRWSDPGIVFGAVPRPSLFHTCTTLADVRVSNFRIPTNAQLHRSEMTLQVQLDTALIVRTLRALLQFVPGVVTLQGVWARIWGRTRANQDEWMADARQMIHTIVDALSGHRGRYAVAVAVSQCVLDNAKALTRCEPQLVDACARASTEARAASRLDLVLNLRRGMASVTIPLLQYESGKWSGDVLTGWDQSGMLVWCVNYVEAHRRQMMGAAMTRAALQNRLHGELHGVFSTITQIAARDPTDPSNPVDVNEVLSAFATLEAVHDMFESVSNIYDREVDVLAAHAEGTEQSADSTWKLWLQRLPVDHRLSLLVLWELAYRACDQLAVRALASPDSIVSIADALHQGYGAGDRLLSQLTAPLRRLWLEGLPPASDSDDGDDEEMDELFVTTVPPQQPMGGAGVGAGAGAGAASSTTMRAVMEPAQDAVGASMVRRRRRRSRSRASGWAWVRQRVDAVFMGGPSSESSDEFEEADDLRDGLAGLADQSSRPGTRRQPMVLPEAVNPLPPATTGWAQTLNGRAGWSRYQMSFVAFRVLVACATYYLYSSVSTESPTKQDRTDTPKTAHGDSGVVTD